MTRLTQLSTVAALLIAAVQHDAAVASSSTSNLTRIAFYVGPGTSSPAALENFYATLEIAAGSVFDDTGGYTLTNVTVPEVQALKRDNYDIIIFPGGSGNGQASAITDVGIAAVRTFHESGGGYIGTCGGAFLGIQHIMFYGNPPPPTQEPFDRGDGAVQVEFSAGGESTLGLNYTCNVTIIYAQGPIVKADDFPPTVQVFATFRSEIHSNHPNQTTGEMVNTPAITALDLDGGAPGAATAAGRVVLNSPHPELFRADGTNLPSIYAGELAWIRAKQLRAAQVTPQSAVRQQQDQHQRQLHQ